MTTLELLSELLKKPNGEIEYSLLILLLKGKINFISLSNQYVNALEYKDKDKANKLHEAMACVIESFLYGKKENKTNHQHIQRCLYLLNESNSFNMDWLNEKYNYNKDEAKNYSWYERNKQEDNEKLK